MSAADLPPAVEARLQGLLPDLTCKEKCDLHMDPLRAAYRLGLATSSEDGELLSWLCCDDDPNASPSRRFNDAWRAWNGDDGNFRDAIRAARKGGDGGEG